MKQQISALQLAFIVGNFIFTGTLVSLQQILIEISKQNSWIVVIITFPITLIFIWVICSKVEKLNKLEGFFDPNNKSILHRGFVILLILFLLFIFIRDFRALTGFINTGLLPDTPIDIIAIITILCLIYISYTGIEVIARITVIHFFTVFVIVMSLPLLLLNEIRPESLQPIGGTNSFSEILKSAYILFPWMGEVFIILFLFIYLKPLKHFKKASIAGAGLGGVLLLILTLLIISVLGLGVASESTYPNISLIQQINLTDFLDRLDLVIVVVWIPTILCKLSLLMYGINKSINVIRGSDKNLGYLPIGLILGLSIHLFKNNIEHLEFSFFSWATLGILLESMLLAIFLIMKYKKKKIGQNSKQKKEVKA